MKIHDFNGLQPSNLRYGGNAGLKKGVLFEGERWLLKFPKNTAGFDKVDISYTTSPLSEYIGSHIYESIGIEAHRTELGVYGNKLVVACKDFNGDNEYLDEYTAIKNDYVEGLDEKLSTSSGTSVDLDEINIIMNNNPVFQNNPDLKKHFWNMFVIDAFIGNNDRNNGNWGLVVNKSTGEQRIAPVYDNGNSFYNKASDEKLVGLLGDEFKFKQSVYDSRTCIFSRNNKDINPLKFIEKGEMDDCTDALLRIFPKIDMDKISNIINEIPSEHNGIKVMSDIQKEFYIRALEYRYENVLEPAFKKHLYFDREHYNNKVAISRSNNLQR